MASRLFMSVIVVAATALGATAASAAGCTGNVQFADAFGQADPGWPTSDNFSIGGGKFQIKPDMVRTSGQYTALRSLAMRISALTFQ